MVRLYVDQPLCPGQSVVLTQQQAHYLFGVMRLSVGAELSVFNGEDGEWRAEVAEVHKRRGSLTAIRQTKPLQLPPDLWLLFAPIKKARTDFIVEKAAEMGVSRICPMRTEFTNSERLRQDRLQAHAVEAAEQCGGTFVPVVEEMTTLQARLNAWPADRSMIFCDEALHDAPPISADQMPGAPAALLIGPEGGFSPTERAALRAHPQATAISLGPRILRADTAAVAALTLWQSAKGDWA